MAQKKILSVGYNFPGGNVAKFDLGSDQSLLDADIIVFNPGLGIPTRSYRGNSYRRGRLEHWRREIATACEAGITVLVFLAKPQEGQTDTGDQISSYSAIPLPPLNFIPASGSEMRANGDIRYFSDYWREFSSCSRYEIYLEGDFTKVDILLKTRSGDRIVGAAIRRGRGTLILVPPLVRPSSDEFVKFGLRLSKSLVAVHKALHSDASITPPPDWSSDPTYRLGREDKLELDIRATSSKIGILQAEQHELEVELKEVGALRRLLYEQGGQLEEAVLDTLKLFGFEAEPYRDADSEFDAVFTSTEGRFLGEAEGKRQARPIHINKLRQLTQNLHDDFARDEVNEFMRRVCLFGNPYRLRPPNDRPDDFTDEVR